MVTRGKTTEEWAYLAGIVDGEGWIGIIKRPREGGYHSPHYQAIVTVTNTHQGLLQWLKSEHGGNLTAPYTDPRGNTVPFQRWAVVHNNAAEFCRGILPYLRIKRRQAALLLEFVDNKQRAAPIKGVKGFRRVTPDELERREQLHQQIKALNNGRRPQRLSETAPDGEPALG